MDPVCSIVRQNDTFRRFFAVFSWFLKFFTVMVFFATIRIWNEQIIAQAAQEMDPRREDDHGVGGDRPRRSNYPRRPRRVAYRPRGVRAA